MLSASLVSILVFLIILALCYWVLTALPLPAIIKTVGTVIIAVVGVLYLIQFLGGAV